MAVKFDGDIIVMNQKSEKIYAIILVAFLVIFAFLSCGKKRNETSPENLLAQIGSKTISVNDFIRRSEYTLRPPYCNQDNYIHKKIMLNSLIAEKLLALEAGENNESF